VQFFIGYSSQVSFCSRLPVRWDNTIIVVMNEVRVSTPYFPENVSGGPAAANERVKKVVRKFSFFFSCISFP
jgi:hypothetical protein